MPHTNTETPALWSAPLACEWEAWRVAGEDHLIVEVPDDDCTDMTGAILMAQALCPTVKCVQVFSRGKSDTTYLWSAETGEWRSYHAPRFR